MIQSIAELEHLKADNGQLQAQLVQRSTELQQAIKQAHQHSEKYLREKEDSETQFRAMYSQLEIKSKSSEDSLNSKIAHLDAETLRLADTLNQLNAQLAERGRSGADLEARLHGEETKRKCLEGEVARLNNGRVDSDEKAHASKATGFITYSHYHFSLLYREN